MIRLEDVSKRYPNGTAALQDVDLSIGPGEFAFLVGSSGAGKSTLIRLLIREELPTTGRVVVNDKDVARMRRSQVPNLRRLVGVRSRRGMAQIADAGGRSPRRIARAIRSVSCPGVTNGRAAER